MKTETSPLTSELEKRSDDAKKTITVEIDALIGQIDANSTEAALAEANNGIEGAARLVNTVLAARTTALLLLAACKARSSAERLVEIGAEQLAIRKQLAVLPVTNELHLILALCYLGAALTAVVRKNVIGQSNQLNSRETIAK